MRLRRLWTLVRREALATFRDPFTVAVLVMVPIVSLLLFGFVLSTDVQRLPLGLLDGDRSAASRRLAAELDVGGTFELRTYLRRSDVDRALVTGEISAAMVIPPGFDRGLGDGRPGSSPAAVQVIYDGGEAVLAGNTEAFLRTLVLANASSLVPDGEAIGGRSRGESAPVATGGVGVVTTVLFNPTLDGKPFMVAGTFGFTFSFLTIMITAVSIVNERLQGTFEQLQVTPATAVEILLGKILPIGAIFALDMALMVMIAGVVIDVWPRGSALLFLGVSYFYVLISLSLGILVSATSATPAEAVQKSVLLSVPIIQTSGFLFPLRNMPEIVAWLAELLPATHYIRICRAIYLRDTGLVPLLPEIGLLLLFGVTLIAYALRSMEARA